MAQSPASIAAKAVLAITFMSPETAKSVLDYIEAQPDEREERCLNTLRAAIANADGGDDGIEYFKIGKAETFSKAVSRNQGIIWIDTDRYKITTRELAIATGGTVSPVTGFADHKFGLVLVRATRSSIKIAVVRDNLVVGVNTPDAPLAVFMDIFLSHCEPDNE